MKLTLLLPSLALAACAPAVQINGAVAVLPPECTPVKAAHAEGLLDIGEDPLSASAYNLALAVTAPEKDITYDAIEVFYTTDQDRGAQLELGQVEGTPVNAASAHRTTVSATSTSDIVVAQIVTTADATLLQTEPFIAGTISSGAKARIVANVTLTGKTSGGSAVSSQLFPFPLDLCAGCLITPPQCGVDSAGNTIQPIVNPNACFAGDDVPAQVCP
jgi:hypothetical protein